MLKKVFSSVFFFAAVITIIAGLIIIHQYTSSDVGRWLGVWLVSWASPDSLKLFAGLVLLILPWLAIWTTWRTGKVLSIEKKQRESDYSAWRKEKEKEIAEGVISGYSTLRGIAVKIIA